MKRILTLLGIALALAFCLFSGRALFADSNSTAGLNGDHAVKDTAINAKDDDDDDEDDLVRPMDRFAASNMSGSVFAKDDDDDGEDDLVRPVNSARLV